MKRLSFFIPLLAFCLLTSAQTKIGYISYEQVLKELPEYTKAQQELATLKAKYDAEAQKGEEEFQRKFVDFLQGQKDFPQAIMQKRQAELQSLMDNGVAFRMKSQELIEQAEKELMKDAYQRLDSALLNVGKEEGFVIILNTDGNNCLFINSGYGIDATELVRQKLGLAIKEEILPDAPAQEGENQ